jgi:hypothetical protein
MNKPSADADNTQKSDISSYSGTGVRAVFAVEPVSYYNLLFYMKFLIEVQERKSQQ